MIRPREDPEDPIEEVPSGTLLPARKRAIFIGSDSKAPNAIAPNHRFYPIREKEGGLWLCDFGCLGLLRDCVSAVEGLLVSRPPITICGKPTQQPRDVGFFSKVVGSFNYSRGNQMPALPLPLVLEALLLAVNRISDSQFDSVLVNRYNNGNDYIAAHSDDVTKYDATGGVACVSIGATRTLRITKKSEPSRRIDLRLQEGVLYKMESAEFQELYTHEILKEKSCFNTRVSFTFRKH